MTAKKTISDEVRRRIELCAYHIWEREGRPLGRESEHWQLAEAEILGAKPVKKASPAKSNGSAKTPKPKKAAAKNDLVAKASAAAKAKKAAKPKSGKPA